MDKNKINLLNCVNRCFHTTIQPKRIRTYEWQIFYASTVQDCVITFRNRRALPSVRNRVFIIL